MAREALAQGEQRVRSEIAVDNPERAEGQRSSRVLAANRE